MWYRKDETKARPQSTFLWMDHRVKEFINQRYEPVCATRTALWMWALADENPDRKQCTAVVKVSNEAPSMDVDNVPWIDKVSDSPLSLDVMVPFAHSQPDSEEHESEGSVNDTLEVYFNIYPHSQNQPYAFFSVTYDNASNIQSIGFCITANLQYVSIVLSLLNMFLIGFKSGEYASIKCHSCPAIL